MSNRKPCPHCGFTIAAFSDRHAATCAKAPTPTEMQSLIDAGMSRTEICREYGISHRFILNQLERLSTQRKNTARCAVCSICTIEVHDVPERWIGAGVERVGDVCAVCHSSREGVPYISPHVVPPIVDEIAEKDKSKHKLTINQARAIREEGKGGASYSQLCERYGVSKSTIYNILAGRTYKCAG